MSNILNLVTGKQETLHEWPAGGTSLQGYVHMPYAKLVALFGEPNTDGDGYKTDAEWTILTPMKRVVTIYNYKDGKNYNGEEGTATEDITEWHIGAVDKSGFEELNAYILGATK